MSDSNVEVIMPLMGEGINEATLVRWLKKTGEQVAKDEPLLEVSTDKVDTEIPSPASGFLVRTMVDAGAAVPINTVIALIGATAAGSAVPVSVAGATKAAAKASPVLAAPPATSPVAHASRVVAATSSYGASVNPGGGSQLRSSPLVRKIAREHSVDLTRVAGSGMAGRITKRDIEDFMMRGPSQNGPAAAPGYAAPISDRLKTDVSGGKETLEGVVVRREKMSKIRKLTAEHMLRSVRVSPHVTTTFEIDLHKVVAIREQHKKAFEAREGFNLTYTHFFIHAAVEAIKLHPIINCSVDGDEILHKDDINVGCAVALESGLIVPVIKRAQDLNLTGVARKLNDLVTRARTKKLQPDDVRGGTFSITNPGGWGSITSNPIINQPQVAILGIGAVVKRPVVVDDAITIRPMVMISLTFDHRVVDGEGGAKYLATLRNLLESYSGDHI